MAKVPAVKYRVSFGKANSTFKGVTGGDFDKDLSNLFEQTLASRIRSRTRIRLSRLKYLLEKRLSDMYTEGLRFQLASLIGNVYSPQERGLTLAVDPNTRLAREDLSKKGAVGFLNSSLDRKPSGSVPWAALKFNTIRTKAKRKKVWRGDRTVMEARKFFVDSGNLRKTLNRGHREMVKKTGIVMVRTTQYRDAKGRFVKATSNANRKGVAVGDISIRLLPGITRSMLPGITTGNWSDDSGNVRFEAALGFDNLTLDKLANSQTKSRFFKQPKRPLLQPIFTYYTLFQAPRTALRAVQEAIGEMT